jgi:hypothetical protein
MTPSTAPPRSETETLATLKKIIDQGRDPSELNDRLGRNRLIEKVIDKFSGKGANTSEDFQNYSALVNGINKLGLANAAEIKVLEDKAATSGDLQGKNKLQIIQLLEEKNVLLPGGAGLYPPVEPKPGLWARIKAVFGWETAT